MRKLSGTSFFTLLVSFLLNVTAAAATGDITTIAGGGIPIVGSNQLSTSFSGGANDVVFDSAGNYYYADSMNHRVYKVNQQGIVSVFAGTGNASYRSNDGLAIETDLFSPNALAFDANGNLHIADSGRCIRKVDSFGTITTVLCKPNNSGSGFSFDSSNNLYYIDNVEDYGLAYSSLTVIKKRTPSGITTIVAGSQETTGDPYSAPSTYGDEGIATQIALRTVTDIFVDTSNNVYFSETGSEIIRKLSTSGMLTTVAGNLTNGYTHDGGQSGVLATSTGLSSPSGIFLDNLGNLFIADSGNHQIRKVNTAGIITTVAGSGIGFPRKSGDGGVATNAKLYNPAAVAVDGSGKTYIADTDNYSVRLVDTDGIITTIAGTGSPYFSGDSGLATSSQLFQPHDVITDAAGNIYIADSGNHRIRKIDTSGIITTVAGTGASGFNGDSIPATSATFDSPRHLAIDSTGNIYVSDYYNRRIRKIDPQGIMTTVVGNGTQDYNDDNSGIATEIPLGDPGDIALDREGNLYVIDGLRVLKINPSGNFTRFAGTGTPGYSGDNGSAINAELRPSSLTIDPTGNVFIGVDNYIRKVNTAGIITTIAGNGFMGSNGDNGPALSASLSSPDGITVDGYGNLYFTDKHERTLRKIDVAGTITRIDNDGLSGPKGIAISSQGNFYVAETSSNLVRQVEGAKAAIIPMYRLYYPGNGKHLYTDSQHEYNALASLGWRQENISFYVYDNPAVVGSETTVAWYRLYNKYSGRHHWTTSRLEYDILGSIGWNQEGVTAYIFATQATNSVPLFRLYNPYSGAHHWTLDANEKRVLVSLGWRDEGTTGYVFESNQ